VINMMTAADPASSPALTGAGGVPLFSVDDHLLEPPDLWTSRLPAKYADECLRMRSVDGVDTWFYEDLSFPTLKMFALAGVPREQWDMGTINYDQMLPACYDPAERSRALRVDGIVGAVTFPTAAGFAGRRFHEAKDKVLADLSVRAYNDFMLDEWWAADREVLVPTIICQMWGPELAAAQIRRCGALGARALTFPENTYALGLPTLHDPVWNPMWEALSEADIVISLHGGASGRSFVTTPESSFMQAVVGAPIITGGEVISELMFAKVTRDYPTLKWVITEVGAGYLPYLLERADFEFERMSTWHGYGELPSEVFHRCMWVPLVDERFAVEHRHLIGVDNLMWKSDSPHPESHWPHSQDAVRGFFRRDSSRRAGQDHPRQRRRSRVPVGCAVRTPEANRC